MLDAARRLRDLLRVAGVSGQVAQHKKGFGQSQAAARAQAESHTGFVRPPLCFSAGGLEGHAGMQKCKRLEKRSMGRKRIQIPLHRPMKHQASKALMLFHLGRRANSPAMPVSDSDTKNSQRRRNKAKLQCLNGSRRHVNVPKRSAGPGV